MNFFQTPSMYVQKSYFKDKFLASAILFRHDVSEGMQE